MRSFSIILILFMMPFVWGQKIDPKWTMNIELGLPTSIANQPFDDIMQGLVSTSLYGQYSFPFHLNIGVGAKYTLMQINEFRVQSPVKGQMHTGAAFIKVGWDKFHNERFATDFSVKVGYAQTYFNTDLNKNLGVNPVQFNKILIEPTAAIILSADERNSYRWSLGYCINGFGFSPRNLGFQDDGGYDPNNFKMLTQYLVVGFGYTFYFGVKAQD